MEHRNDEERVRDTATLEGERQDERSMDGGSTAEGRDDVPTSEGRMADEPTSEGRDDVPTSEGRDDGSTSEGRDDGSTSEGRMAEPDEQDTVPEDRHAATAGGDQAAIQTAPSKGADRFELYTGSDIDGYRRRWDELQAGFVDDPRAAADQADMLIGELVDRVSQRRRQLHDELGGRPDGDTESMRVAVQRYRALFHALVHEQASAPQRA